MADEMYIAEVSIEEAAENLLSLQDQPGIFPHIKIIERACVELRSALDRGDYDVRADAIAARSKSAATYAQDPLVRLYEGRIAAGALVMHENGLVLAFRRKSESVGIPCGKLEHGETPLQAALREVKEETGYDIEIDTRVTPYVGFDANDTLVFTYKAKICGGDIHVRPIDEGTPCWTSCQALIEGKYGTYNSRMLNHFEVSYPAWWKHREMEGWIADARATGVEGVLDVTLFSPGARREVHANMETTAWVALSDVWRLHGCVVRVDPVAKFR